MFDVQAQQNLRENERFSEIVIPEAWCRRDKLLQEQTEHSSVSGSFLADTAAREKRLWVVGISTVTGQQQNVIALKSGRMNLEKLFGPFKIVNSTQKFRAFSIIHATFTLAKAAEADRLMETGSHIGRIILLVASESKSIV